MQSINLPQSLLPYKELFNSPPFSQLSSEQLSYWLEDAHTKKFSVGERFLRPDEISPSTYLILKGTVRHIAVSADATSQISLHKESNSAFVGWSSLLRGSATEFVQASTSCLALALSSVKFVELYQANQEFASYFDCLTEPCEFYTVLQNAIALLPKVPEVFSDDLMHLYSQSVALSIQDLDAPLDLPVGKTWFVSTPDYPGIAVGSILSETSQITKRQGYLLPLRLLGVPLDPSFANASQQLETNVQNTNTSVTPFDLQTLGILEADVIDDSSKYPIAYGKGELAEALAVCKMAALYLNVPFRNDQISKIIQSQLKRNKDISLELLAGVTELLGLQCQLAETSSEFCFSIEGPAVLILDTIPVVLFGFSSSKAMIGHPHLGLISLPSSELIAKLPERFRFVLPRRTPASPTSRFGWSWFSPLLKKYKKPLVLVLIASFLAQILGLGIPLLLQQIIDKVLSQGNTSSLNVLGSAMIIMALFQGFLQALRTFIFVDTSDRMDLTLGSAVIDRLLSLPLPYFDKRPVGELSQRLSELNTIRSFLTGTALISVLNIVFAAIYIVVMFLYSPLLSIVALSTLPLYLLLVLVVAPIYKSLIRRRAVASARTQSHLIEVIGGIQTVKAQHFELTSRWKWQDKYREVVHQGFKSTALGAVAGEIGTFLTQVSGLLVLWVGMYLVLQGQFTLGQLIAFRIISGNVTGPLLQLAGLYQGFQSVQLSMERLSDIVDQEPELQKSSESSQISLPPIAGKVVFEDISFRFGSTGPMQVQNVNVEISAGSFVGIVVQSGSGKSTLMKLLPRLYSPASGRILVDDYDISKIDLSSLRRQVGIVPQDSLLFDGTVAENISLNDPNASTESIIDAARIACAHEFIMTLPQGYATPIAERGSNLSGGQRQRIAIARTVLSNPQLLILDEATSALDFLTERDLCINLQKWAAGKTVFFITHRLSTISNSDVILLMHQGRLEEEGTHSTLLEAKGRYASLFKQQSFS